MNAAIARCLFINFRLGMEEFKDEMKNMKQTAIIMKIYKKYGKIP